MNVVIIGGNEKDYGKLDAEFNRIMEEKGIFLFNIIAAAGKRSLGRIWAERNGAPLKFVNEKDPKKIIKILFREANYIIFMYDGSQQMKNLIMQYKMTGKHGSVINV